MKLRRLASALLLAALAALAHAEVSLPRIFTDHMVLQRDQPVAIWGTAAAGESVTVRFAADTQSTVADSKGAWSVRLRPLAASAEGRELVVSGTNTLTFTDVLVGEVWLGSGQSNMEKQLGARSGQQPCDNHEAEIAAADHPLLRIYQVPRNGKATPDDLSFRWLPCSPETVAQSQFSALGYYFGRRLLTELKVPIGIIHSSVGGSRIEPWIPSEAFAGRPEFAAISEAVSAGQTYRGQRVGNLYASMIRPLTPYTLRGWLWYQGESNAMTHENSVYVDKMRLLVESWRAAWQQPDGPFFHVQLAPYTYSRRRQPEPLSAEALPLFWEAQDRSLAIPHTGQAVINDTVTRYSDIHPTNKKDVGERLALVALRDTYGRSDIVASGPTLAGHDTRGSSIALRFESAAGLGARAGGPLTGFMIAGPDKTFVPATAELRGNEVVVSAASVAVPVAVRYGWHETRTGNLTNAAGLPARSFRTDDWPVDTTRPATPEDLAPPPPRPAPITPAPATSQPAG